MPSREVAIGSSVGLHARPANLFVQEVNKLGVPVTLQKEGRPPVDARSLLGIMTLGVKHGEVVTLAAEGDGADEALDALVEFLKIDHDATDA
ncbi:HPr family phosphocarrier protein [Tessaracoccus massiliensis]|uniref:HPr family phosphocarrier protein n=1 Tax=Tessaracoccus massiliensis TaxID=1522311 RepID=UPI00058BE106|nr:HPr family phosphocarrier protein [Tessaracoccus massiliensis]